jgi:hypothetical protein
MSYSVNLKSQDGTVTVTGTSGTVPDGTWTVNGHEDANYASVGVARAKPEGGYVAQATATAYPVAFTTPAEVTA